MSNRHTCIQVLYIVLKLEDKVEPVKSEAATKSKEPQRFTLTSDGRYVPAASVDFKSMAGVLVQTTPVIKNPTVEMALDWDGWPDGDFEQDFTFQECTDTSNLRVHWAVKANGGYRKGNKHAKRWEDGKKSSRTCLGIIECDNPTCSVITRPHVTPNSIYAQLQRACICGAKLFNQECDVISYLYTWSGGIHFSNVGYHTHRRPTHILHLLPQERRRFEEIVKAHPRSGPLQLIVGVPGLDEPGESVADISDVLLNADRVSKERQKIKHGQNNQTADGFISAFRDFELKYPNFILESNIGSETVISLQTSFMRSQLVKKDRLDGSVNGLVNDAAHGWWAERTSLLMITSTYCPVLFCWVPGVITYTNGASGAHFQYHFFAVILSIASEAESRNIPVTDELFAGVSPLCFNCYTII
jgi:hypothetical protein